MAARRSVVLTAMVLILAPLSAAPVIAGEKVVADQLYGARCAFCHGDDGKGDGIAAEGLDPRPTDFTDPSFWDGRTDGQVRLAIEKGKPGTAMVPFGGSLNAAEIEALAAHLRSFAGR